MSDRPLIRIVVVDDHPVFRMGMIALIGSVDGVVVAGEASTAAEAIDVVRAAAPDVVILDLQLPDSSGIEVARTLLTERADLGVLVLTMFEDDDAVHAALRVGARGYLVKGADQEQIERAIRAVAAGDAILGPSVAGRASALVSGTAPLRRFPQLSDREREVLDLIARGLDNRSIGRRLVVSEKTVRNHASNVFTKLGVASRAEAIVRAREAGFGQSE